jgi:hypothetical protein
MDTDPITQAMIVLNKLLSEGKPVRVQLERNGLRGELTIQPITEATPNTRMDPLTRGERMAATENVIVSVLRTCEKSLKRIRIAERAKCKSDRNFASALKRLCETGRVLRCPSDCYWLASRGPAPSVVPLKPALRRRPPR